MIAEGVVQYTQHQDPPPHKQLTTDFLGLAGGGGGAGPVQYSPGNQQQAGPWLARESEFVGGSGPGTIEQWLHMGPWSCTCRGLSSVLQSESRVARAPSVHYPASLS